jgi:hypothetical protein
MKKPQSPIPKKKTDEGQNKRKSHKKVQNKK